MPVSAAIVRAQLQKLLASSQLARSDALGRLLRFVVEQTLEGRGDELKETRLGLEVFGRTSAHYDSAIDPIVRVQMGRLRHRLRAYYSAHDATTDPVLIDVPKGRYVPVFERRMKGDGHREPEPAPAGRAAPPHRIAVLPFVNMSAATGSEYFSDGLTEELIHVLARDAQLQVVARTSSFQFKQQARDVREIGRLLGVDKIVEGSVRQSGARVRITAQLINVADGCHLWSERYERDLTDIFAIHDEIAAAVHEALHTRLAQDGPARAESHVLEAYNEYLRGRCLWNSRTAQGLRAAIEHFRLAVSLDPKLARAFAGMADSYLLLGLSGAEPPDRVMPEARTAAERSLAADRQLAEAHASLAAIHAVYERNRSAAAAGFRRAQELDPNYATAHHWNGLLNALISGRFDEARAELKCAVNLDPLALPILADLALVHCFTGNHAEAEVQCHRALELAPHFHRPYWFLGISLACRGEFAAAEDALVKALTLCTDEAFQSRIIGTLGFCYGRWARRAAAEEQLRKLGQLSATRYVPRWDVAQIHAGLGDSDAACAELEAANTGRETYAVFTPIWPTLREFRRERRFRELCRQSTQSARESGFALRK